MNEITDLIEDSEELRIQGNPVAAHLRLLEAMRQIAELCRMLALPCSEEIRPAYTYAIGILQLLKQQRDEPPPPREADAGQEGDQWCHVQAISEQEQCTECGRFVSKWRENIGGTKRVCIDCQHPPPPAPAATLATKWDSSQQSDGIQRPDATELGGVSPLANCDYACNSHGFEQADKYFQKETPAP